MEENSIAEAAVAYRQLVKVKERHDLTGQEGTGHDHIGAGWLQADNLASVGQGEGGQVLQQRFDPAARQAVAGHPLSIVRRKAEVDRGEGGGGARGPHEDGALWMLQGFRDLPEALPNRDGCSFQFREGGRIAFEVGLGGVQPAAGFPVQEPSSGGPVREGPRIIRVKRGKRK